MRHPRAMWFDRLAQEQAQTADDAVFGGELEAQGTLRYALTADEIRAQRFRTRLLGGLDPEEVSAFLEDVADALDSAQSQHVETEKQVGLLQARLEALTTTEEPRAPSAEIEPVATDRDAVETTAAPADRLEDLRRTVLREVEALLHDAQVRAQALLDAALERAAATVREADALRCQRQHEAEVLVAEATVTADAIVSAAREQETMVRREIDHLGESRLRVFDEVRAMLEACDEWLATVDPRLHNGAEPKKRSASFTNGPLSMADDRPVR